MWDPNKTLKEADPPFSGNPVPLIHGSHFFQN